MAATGYNIQTTQDTISFRDQTTGLASIFYDHSTESLVISHDGTGALSFGDTASDVYIGDGVNSINMIFEVDGAIKGDTDVTLTLGSTDSDVLVASPMTINNTLDVTGSLGVTGSLTIDTDTLYVDASNNRVGIGTTSPQAQLHVESKILISQDTGDRPKLAFSENLTNSDEFVLEYNGAGSSTGNYVAFYSDISTWAGVGQGLNYIPANGYVGIGTTSPSEKLQVDESTTSTYVASFHNAADNLKLKIGTTTGALLNIQGATINTNAAYNISLQADGGNVGIGTTSPSSKLEVNGTLEISPTEPTINLNRSNGSYSWKIVNGAGGGNFPLSTFNIANNAGTPVITALDGGNVGIGTTSPSTKLDVSGSVTATSLIKSGGTSSQFLKADGSVDSNTYLSLSGGTMSGTINLNGNGIQNGGYIAANTSSTRSKFRLWNTSTDYAIGMQSGVTYGGLSDYAMTFQMNNLDDRGFWWGDSGHSTAQGAMSLTTDGELNVAKAINVGGGESDTSFSATYPIYATANATGYSAFFSGTVGIGTISNTMPLTVDENASKNSAVFIGTIKLPSYTVAALPAATAGQKAFVTDAVYHASTSFGAVVAGGGSYFVPVYSDGSNWRVG